MRLSWNEVRARAAAFANDWRDAAYEIFLLGESGARDHPERLHDLSTMEKGLLPAAVAHFTAAGHSLQLSTETG